MKLKQLKEQLAQFLYLEDEDVVDIVLASALANLKSIGNPVWLVVVGASSSGKTQVLMPLDHAQADGKKTIHKVTDLTPNTFLSGAKTKEYDPSLLTRIGEDPGMLLFPDLTSLFSKDAQVLQEVLGQLRHVYDGYLVKHTGNGPPLEWNGSLGILAASTASLYHHFEGMADMGERFLYYRMKPFNGSRALETAMTRKLSGKALDTAIGALYHEYLSGVASHVTDVPKLHPDDIRAISEMAKIASIIRTPVSVDKFSGLVDRIPEPEMPMRTALQLRTLAGGLAIMNVRDNGTSRLSDANLRALEWCAFSLANDERRATLRTLATYLRGASASAIGQSMRLPTKTAERVLEQLNALGLVTKTSGGPTSDLWQLNNEKLIDAVRRALDIEVSDDFFDVDNTFSETDF